MLTLSYSEGLLFLVIYMFIAEKITCLCTNDINDILKTCFINSRMLFIYSGHVSYICFPIRVLMPQDKCYQATDYKQGLKRICIKIT